MRSSRLIWSCSISWAGLPLRFARAGPPAAQRRTLSAILSGKQSRWRNAVVPRGSAWLWLAAAVIGLVALLFALNARFPDALEGQGGLPRLVYLLGVVAVGGGGVALAIRR